MGQVRHGSAPTTHAIRTAIQRSEASTAALSRERRPGIHSRVETPKAIKAAGQQLQRSLTFLLADQNRSAEAVDYSIGRDF